MTLIDYQDAVSLIRAAQDELITELENVHFGADPDGLATAREWDPSGKADDIWHYSPETYEELGRQLAKEILEFFDF